MKKIQKLVVIAVLLLSQVALFADQSPTHILLKLSAQKAGINEKFYIYICPYDYDENTKSNFISLKINPNCKNNNELNKFFHYEIKEIHIPKHLFTTKKIERNEKIPFLFGKGEFIDLTKYTSIKLDSTLESGFSFDIRMLDNETYNTLTTQKVVSIFEMILDSDEFGSSFLVVVSFNDLWSQEYSLSQFYGFRLFSDFEFKYQINQEMGTWKKYIELYSDYKPQNNNNQKMDDSEKSVEYFEFCNYKLKRKLSKIILYNRQGEVIVLKKRLPKTIQKAIQEKKIVLFPDYSF